MAGSCFVSVDVLYSKGFVRGALSRQSKVRLETKGCVAALCQTLCASVSARRQSHHNIVS